MHSFFCYWPHWTLQKIAITSYELSYSHRQVIYYYIICVLFLNKIGANYSFLFLTSFRIWVNSLLFLTFLCCSYGVWLHASWFLSGVFADLNGGVSVNLHLEAKLYICCCILLYCALFLHPFASMCSAYRNLIP
jgi:hypothetical protein